MLPDQNFILILKIYLLLGLPCGPVVKTSPYYAEGVGLIPGRGARIPHASCNIVTNSIKTLKMVHIKKIYFLKNILAIEYICRPIEGTPFIRKCVLCPVFFYSK